MADLSIYFIDVGMGDGTLIVCPDKTSILVDLGSTQGSEIKANALNVFKRVFGNPKEIDYLIMTHHDRDHYNWIRFLLEEGYSFGKIYHTGHINGYRSGGILTKGDHQNQDFRAWLREMYQSQKVWRMQCPDGLKNFIVAGDVKIHVLASDLNGRAPGATAVNTLSTVLLLEYASKKVLLGADATYLTEGHILAKIKEAQSPIQGMNLKCDILKVGHHGSARSSTSQEWVEAIQPKCLFISADRVGRHEGVGGAATGHRLPQQAAVDTVLQFIGGEDQLNQHHNNHGQVAFHPYVAYRDGFKGKQLYGFSRSHAHWCNKGDDADNLKDQTLAPDDLKSFSNTYYEVKTDRQIYTSIMKLDASKNEAGLWQDHGTSYTLIIDRDPHQNYQVLPWDEDFEKLDHWGSDRDKKCRQPPEEIKRKEEENRKRKRQASDDKTGKKPRDDEKQDDDDVTMDGNDPAPMSDDD